jgi:hypothetical protein
LAKIRQNHKHPLDQNQKDRQTLVIFLQNHIEDGEHVWQPSLISNSFLFLLLPKKSNSKHSNIFSLFISHQLFFIIIQKKTHYKTKLFHFSINTIPKFLILYITSITFYYYSNKNSTTQPFIKHTCHHYLLGELGDYRERERDRETIVIVGRGRD